MAYVINNSPIINSLGIEDKERRERLLIWIEPMENHRLQIMLSVTFDFSVADEAIMRRFAPSFGNSYLLKYELDMDLKAEKYSLRSKIIKAYNNHQILRASALIKVEEDTLNEILAPIAEQGVSIFYRLFLDDSIRFISHASSYARDIQKAIKSVLKRPQIISITINNSHNMKTTNAGYLFPWAFLYDDVVFDSSNRSKLDPKKFWGFKHELQTEIGDTTSCIAVPSLPKILTAICSQVDSQGWHSTSDHPFKNYSTTNNIIPVKNIVDLGHALADFNEDCFYFFGHAHHSNNPTPSQSWLKLLGQDLTVDKLNRLYNAPKFKKDPVIGFFNGCNTSPLEEWDDSTVIGFLCRRGNKRLCCVATVAEIPDTFAAEFAKHFWVQFLEQKKTIGIAILLARTKMLEQWNNPLGLLYSLFGYVDTKIQ